MPPPKPPAVGSRWRFGRHGATYEIIDHDGSEGFVRAKTIGSLGNPIGGLLELRIASFGHGFIEVVEEEAA